MANIRSFEPLWGQWRSVKLLSQGVGGKIYLMEKVEEDKRYYAAVRYIAIPDGPDKRKESDAQGTDDDACLDDRYRQQLDSLLAEIEINSHFTGNRNIAAYKEYWVFPRKNGMGFDVFIRMELLHRLSEYQKSHPMTNLEAAKLGEDICSALETLQRENVVHGDVRPDNIFVDDEGNYKLGNLSATGVPPGKRSLSFKAPEVVMGELGDPGVDLYALGLTLYRLVNHGRGPFLPPISEQATKSVKALAHKRRLRGEPLPPPAQADDVLAGIILKACAFVPGDRWENAGQMRKALTDYRQHLNQTMMPKAEAERFQRGTFAEAAAIISDVERDEKTEIIHSAMKAPEERRDEGDMPHLRPSEPEDSSNEETSFRILAQKEPYRKEEKSRKKWIWSMMIVLLLVVFAAYYVATHHDRLGKQQESAIIGSSYQTIDWTALVAVEAARVWRDPVIEAAVRAVLGLENGDLDADSLAGVKELRLRGSSEQISTLADLDKLPGLQTLDLGGHPVKQFDFPEGMAALIGLNLTGCGCTSLEFMSHPKLQGLVNLALGDNQLSDLTRLEGLSQLRYLDISGNPLQDLGPLSGLSDLAHLVALDVPVSDWHPVEGVKTVKGRPEDAAQMPPQQSAAPSFTPVSPPKNSGSAASPNPSPIVMTPVVSSVSLSRSSALLAMGERITLTAQISPADAAGGKITWTSSNPAIANVDSNGNVTAIGNGTAIITASSGGCTGTCAISVG